MSDETEQEYSERMHRENNPHYFREYVPWNSDDEVDGYDPDPEYDENGEDMETCPWCGSTYCGHIDDDGCLVCCVTKRIIP